MKILDLSVFAAMPPDRRLELVQIVGDALDAERPRPFGILYEGKHFALEERPDGSLGARLVDLLDFTAGNVDGQLVELPRSERDWLRAAELAEAHNASVGGEPFWIPPGRIDEVRSMADPDGFTPTRVMIGRAGFAAVNREGPGWICAYHQFFWLEAEQKQRAMGVTPDGDNVELLDHSERPFTEAEVATLLRRHEASIGYPHDRDAMPDTFTHACQAYQVLLILEHVRMSRYLQNDPETAAAISDNTIIHGDD